MTMVDDLKAFARCKTDKALAEWLGPDIDRRAISEWRVKNSVPWKWRYRARAKAEELGRLGDFPKSLDPDDTKAA